MTLGGIDAPRAILLTGFENSSMCREIMIGWNIFGHLYLRVSDMIDGDKSVGRSNGFASHKGDVDKLDTYPTAY